MRPIPNKQRGTALIITVGLLAVLAVIGFGFAVLARLQHDISSAYRAAAQNELIAQAALYYAVGEIRWGWANVPDDVPLGSEYWNVQTGAIADPTDSPRDPWFVDPTIAARGYVASDGFRHYCNLRCNSYALVHDELGARLGVSNIRVLDAAAKLNLNDQDGPIDGNGNPDTTRQRAILTQLLLKLPLGLSDAQATTLTNNIFNARTTLTDKRYSSLEQLARFLTLSGDAPGADVRRYEILKHYLTIYSWPHQLPVVNSFPYVVNPTGSDSLERKSSSLSTTPKDYYYRSPININTASWELLYALLRNIRLSGTDPEISDGDAEKIAWWITRKRAGKYDPNCVVPGTTSLADFDPATWNGWTTTSSLTKYRESLERRFEGWCAYPVGPFDSWGEVMDFLYSLVRPHDPASDPFPAAISGAAAEAVIAGTSPNAFAAGLAGYNAWHLGYPHLKKEGADSAMREQFLRDRAVQASVEPPEVVGRHALKARGDAYPFCFSSLGRHEVYTRTYTFLKADQGTVTAATDNTLTDNNKVWLSSPSQWRGYTVAIHAGKGKGQMRGIVYVKDDGTPNDGKGHTLVVDRWGITPDTTSRYYIVGPGAFVDRQPTSDVATPVEGGALFKLTDSSAKWENGQWNGHRVVVYRGSVDNGTETIVDASLQERTIIETIKPCTLVVAPDLDPNLLSGGANTGYLILGTDGLVEHSGAFKAYDVIHHTTQQDFETGRTTSPSSGYTLAASGPNHYLKADGSLISGATPSKIDGWLAVRKRDAAIQLPGSATEPVMLHSFNTHDLKADEINGTPSGTCPASNPPAATIVADTLSQDGKLLSDGLHLTGGSANFVDLRLNSDLCTYNTGDEGNRSGEEGGFVSLWIRPNEAFFAGATAKKIVQVLGRTNAGDAFSQEEEIALQVRDGVLEVVVKFRSPNILFKNVTDTKTPIPPYGPRPVNFNDGEYITRTYTGPDIRSGAKPWKPGEWHHVAFAWYECYDGRLAGGVDDDLDDTSSALDDKVVLQDSKNVDMQRLDEEVSCSLRMWVDGTPVSDTRKDQAAFNFASPAAPKPMVRLSGAAEATVDGLVVFRHTDKDLGFSVPVDIARYDAYESYDNNGVPSGNPKPAEYASGTISGINPNNDRLTLGTVAWTGFFPWMKPEDRWGGPGGTTANFPIRVEVSLGNTNSQTIPPNNPLATKPMPSVFNGGALRGSADALIENTATTLKYKVYFYPAQGSDTGDNDPGTLKGRQTPVLEDITITYLGPVVFYFWK